MPIKLSDVKGLMGNKIKLSLELKRFFFYVISHGLPVKFKQLNKFCDIESEHLIYKQGSKSIGLNRERLAMEIYTYHQNKMYGMDATPWDKIQGHIELKQYYEEADAIIAKEHELIEVKK